MNIDHWFYLALGIIIGGLSVGYFVKEHFKRKLFDGINKR